LQLQLPNATTTPLVNDSFTAFGQVWKKLDLPPNYTSSFGGTASVVQNGTPSLTFINSQGQTSAGFWTSPTTLSAASWGLTATVGNGTITFSNGDVWTESVVLKGTKNGVAGTTSIAATGPTAVLPNPPVVSSYVNTFNNLQKEYVVEQGPTTALFFNDTGVSALGTLINNGTQATIAAWGVTATFGSGKITFSGPIPGGSTSWTQTPLTASPFTITSYVNAANSLSDYVIQNNLNTSATFIKDDGTWVLGTVVGTTATAPGLSLGTGTLSAGKISWSVGPTTWVQTTLAANVVSSAYYYNAANGKSEQLIFNGAYLIFINDAGIVSFGALNAAKTQATVTLGATTYIATGNFTSSAAVGNVTFALPAAPNTVVMTWVKTNALTPLITLTDTNATTFHVRVTSSTTFVVIDGTASIPANTIGTRQSNKITWSNNAAIWNNFDFNALNALFQMSAGYP
jgi:hypothetical protein